MKRAPKAVATEEFVVKFWVKNSEGFAIQESRSFKYHSKNRHKQAVKDCIAALKKEGKVIDVISSSYQ